MTKEIFKKITQDNTFLDITEISAQEKKELLSYLAEKGFTRTTFYLRFFQKGFSEWEIIGVKECKNRFILLPDVAEALLSYVDEDDTSSLPGDKGYYYTLAKSEEAGVFYKCLFKANRGLRQKFYDYMSGLGMSEGTTVKRFKEENWKEWEVEGLSHVLSDYMASRKE